MRVNTQDIKNILLPKPNDILNAIYISMPPFIKKKTEEISGYLLESIRALKSSTTNVRDFVKQMKSLKETDKKVPKVKDKISFIGQIVNVLENLKFHIKTGLEKDSSKTWKSYQTHLLQ